jgi:hypothetical protein
MDSDKRQRDLFDDAKIAFNDKRLDATDKAYRKARKACSVTRDGGAGLSRALDRIGQKHGYDSF